MISVIPIHLAWPFTILQNDNITISWYFFRLMVPRCPVMAAGAVSLRKFHDIGILSFCNIVKGQAKCIIIPISCFSYDIMRKWIIRIIACQNFSLSDEIFQIMSNEIMINSDVFIRITYFIISSMKKWEKQLISHSKCTYIVELLHKNVGNCSRFPK